jgi:Rhodopirellula transposase DDE domain
MVEHRLPKPVVAGSIPVSRSNFSSVFLMRNRCKYPTGRKVTKEEMKGINLQPDRFHGKWNYVIRPH